MTVFKVRSMFGGQKCVKNLEDTGKTLQLSIKLILIANGLYFQKILGFLYQKSMESGENTLGTSQNGSKTVFLEAKILGE